MEVFGMAALFGLILGLMFGVGCAFAVLYTIYMGGYRKAIRDSLSNTTSEKYVTELRKADEKLAKDLAVTGKF
ncbi:hypothetical protein [Acidicapsa acidisoli]|uniref:hypothetical protein n=1 Tax=Acidicapsa acidisoli TaxID=1615681 RepID=UPI0021E05333|nr:hypothetical protein [Acidicapsa acidisoli]